MEKEDKPVKGLWVSMQEDGKVYQKGNHNLNILTDMMKGMVSTAPKINIDSCTIEPYDINEEGGVCWCIKADNRVIAVSNRAGCEQFLKAAKDAKNDR